MNKQRVKQLRKEVSDAMFGKMKEEATPQERAARKELEKHKQFKKIFRARKKNFLKDRRYGKPSTATS